MSDKLQIIRLNIHVIFIVINTKEGVISHTTLSELQHGVAPSLQAPLKYMFFFFSSYP